MIAALQGTGSSVPALPDWLRASVEDSGRETAMEYLARHSHSFRYAARFLPPPYDGLVADVYAFCRFTDDLVDAAGETPVPVLRERLGEWRALAARAYTGSASGFALLDRPMAEMARRGIPFALAEELIEGVGMDLEPRRYATLEELDVYSYRVASVVGLWLTRLVGVRDPAVLERAADLGNAMQLTNILRDVGEDLSRGRLYLPLDVLARHGIDPEILAGGAGSSSRLPSGWKDAMEELMAMAEARYARALEAVPALPGFFRRAVLISGLVYRDIHEAIRRNGHDNLTRRAHTTRARKVWLGFKARARLALMPLRGAGRLPRRASTAAVLASTLSLMSLGAADAPSVRMGDAEAVARRELATVDAALKAYAGDRRDPRDSESRAELLRHRLRLLHALSVQDAGLLPAARAAREAATAASTASATAGDAALMLAYRGALEVVEARHAFWPRARMEPLRRGLPLLDSAVRLAPENAEIRYLRLTSGYYLPFFLGRKNAVREDFAALGRLLPAAKDAFPPLWYVAVADFVLDKGDLAAREQERLRRARAAAAAAMNRDLSRVEGRGPDYSRIP